MERLFKNSIKAIKKLHNKKGREESSLFIIEGIKTVSELKNIKIKYIVVSEEFLENKKLKEIQRVHNNVTFYYTSDFSRISTMSSFEGILAVAELPKKIDCDKFVKNKSKIIFLDEVNDPGNLGTIIRTALWFGVEGIILNGKCADIYSPKVIRSSMGSIFRVDILLTENILDNKEYFNEFIKVGTFLDEDSNYEIKHEKKIMLMFGNEANGLNHSLKEFIDYNYLIERKSDFESLNLSIAAAITINNLLS